MKQIIGRRGLLGLLAAAPVAAREAASKAGITRQFDRVAYPPAPAMLSGSTAVGGHKQWMLERAKEWLTGQAEEEIRRNIGVGALDPDIASMRSLSLTGAIQMQRARNIKREIESQRSYFEREIEKLFGKSWRSLVE